MLQLNALHTDLANQMADSMVFPLIQFREKDLTGSSAHRHTPTNTCNANLGFVFVYNACGNVISHVSEISTLREIFGIATDGT